MLIIFNSTLIGKYKYFLKWRKIVLITNEQLKKCKTLLQNRQSKLIKQVQDKHFGLDIQQVEAADELSHYDNHPADMGTALFERGKDLALNELAEKELEDINESLHAIEEGTYGICTDCGEDIPFERLQAVPTADKCVEHAEQKTFSRARPIEEEVYSPNINPDEVTDEDQVGYDAEDAWQEVSRYGTSETPSDFYGDRDDYDEMYPNSDELVSDVESIEAFASADINGKFSGVAPNHNKYEEDEF